MLSGFSAAFVGVSQVLVYQSAQVLAGQSFIFNSIMQYTHGFNSGDDVGAGEAVKWRTNPKTAGPTFVLGDIGTHLYYLSEVVLPHLKIDKLLCDRKAFILTRAPLEDHARSMGAHAEKVASIAELEAKIVEARGRNVPSVIVIDTDAVPGTGAGGSWWDVAVPQAGGPERLETAREHYNRNAANQRVFD